MINLFSVDEELEARLDRFLTEKFSNHSRSYFQNLINEGHVKVNGQLVKKQHKLSKGDQVEVTFQSPPLLDVQPENIPLDIVYEDDYFLVINKPAGMVVHPAPGAYNATFANALLFHCTQLKADDFDPLRPGIVHRLDKETTGLLIGAKTHEAHQKLAHLFAERQIEKRYLAICHGTPKEGLCDAPIKRHPIHRKQMSVDATGKPAQTVFGVLYKSKELSVVEARLITGRTHQIRVHLKYLKSPIIGDATYGSSIVNQKYKASRPMLHSYQLKFNHPFTNQLIELKAPLPNDLENFIEFIRQGV